MNEDVKNCEKNTIHPELQAGKNSPCNSVGVCFDVSKGKYKAYVDIFGVRVNLGSSFINEDSAIRERESFLENLYCDNKPLIEFLKFRFGLSQPQCVFAIADSVCDYVSVFREDGFGMKFPNFVVKRVRDGLPSNFSLTMYEAMCDAINNSPAYVRNIIFGSHSIASVRKTHKLRYENVVDTLSDLAFKFSNIFE